MGGNKIELVPLEEKLELNNSRFVISCVSNHLLLSELTTAIIRGSSHSQPSVFRGEAKNRHQAELLEESNLHAGKGNHYCCSEGLSEAHICN